MHGCRGFGGARLCVAASEARHECWLGGLGDDVVVAAGMHFKVWLGLLGGCCW